jgi:hypothetical protein
MITVAPPKKSNVPAGKAPSDVPASARRKAAYTVERTAYTISWWKCGSDVEGFPAVVQQRPMLVQVRPAPMRSLRAVVVTDFEDTADRPRLERLVGSIDGRSRAFKPRCRRHAERAGAHPRICSPSHPRLSPWLNSKMADPRLRKQPRQLCRPTSARTQRKASRD